MPGKRARHNSTRGTAVAKELSPSHYRPLATTHSVSRRAGEGASFSMGRPTFLPITSIQSAQIPHAYASLFNIQPFFTQTCPRQLLFKPPIHLSSARITLHLLPHSHNLILPVCTPTSSLSFLPSLSLPSSASCSCSCSFPLRPAPSHSHRRVASRCRASCLLLLFEQWG